MKKPKFKFARERAEKVASDWCDDLPLTPETTREFQLFYAGYMLGQLNARQTMIRSLVGDEIPFDRVLQELESIEE